MLELNPDMFPQLLALAPRIATEHPHGPRVGAAQSFQTFDGGGLARPVGAEDPEDLALLHAEGDPVQDHALVVPLTEIGDFDDRHGHQPDRPACEADRPSGRDLRGTW